MGVGTETADTADWTAGTSLWRENGREGGRKREREKGKEREREREVDLLYMYFSLYFS